MARLKLGSLIIDIGADTSGLDASEKKVKAIANKMSKSFSRLGAVISGALAIEATRRILLIADNMKLLDVRIRASTRSQNEFNRSRQKLIEISVETGSTLAENVKLFEALTLSAKDLGATNPQVLQLTESLNKLGVIGGSSVDAMKFSLRQLSQAMAGGIVRAEEWNSILENTPFIANAIADGLGLSVGKLRLMVIEGKLLADDVFNSLLKQTDSINERFEKMPLTIERASAAALTNFSLVVAEINKGVDITGTLAKGIKAFADSITEIPNDVRAVFSIIIGEIDQLFITSVAKVERLGLVIKRLFVFDEESRQDIADQISAINLLRDRRIKASKEAVDAAIAEEIRLVIFKRTGSAAGGEVSNTVAGSAASATISKSDQAKLNRIKRIGEMEREAIQRVAEENRKFILAQDQLTADERRALTDNINAAEIESLENLEERKQLILRRSQSIGLAAQASFLGNVQELLRKAGTEGSAIAKAAFLAQKGIQIAQILVATETAAIAAGAHAALLRGAPGFFAAASVIRATGAASAGLVAGMAVADTFEHGGVVGGSSFSGDNMIARVNSGEMILNKTQQSKLFNMANGGGGSSPTIIINNNAPGAEVVTQSITRDQVVLLVREGTKNAVNQIDSSLARGQGSTAQALNIGFNTSRNIT